MPRSAFTLVQIALHAAELLDMLEGVPASEYANNRIMIRATERLLEIIGEASRTLDEPTRQRMPEVPWTQVVGLRHRITHEYFRINALMLYAIAFEHVPVLLAAVHRVMAEDGIDLHDADDDPDPPTE